MAKRADGGPGSIRTERGGVQGPHDVSRLAPVSAEVAARIKLAANIPVAAVLPEAAAASMVVAERATKPGKERWPVKVVTDKDADDVGKNVIDGEQLGAGVVDTTVEELISITRPPDMQPPTQLFPAYEDERSEPVESTIWRLEADVIAFKQEADGDYHLVLQGDSGETMIAEVPTPTRRFLGSSPWKDNIAETRRAVDEGLLQHLSLGPMTLLGRRLVPSTALPNQPATSFARPVTAPAVAAAAEGADAEEGPFLTFQTKLSPKRARITGVGFFDRVHRQLGVSQSNGIELHPILKLEWV